MENNEVIVEQLEEPVDDLLEDSLDPESPVQVEEVNEGELEDGTELQDASELLSDEVVSGGDSVSADGESAAAGSQVINQITIDGAEVYVVQEYTLLGETAKPIEAYSVTEGLLLCIFLVLLGQAISRVIGGVLNCKHLFKE